jgi:hypothetical protein
MKDMDAYKSALQVSSAHAEKLTLALSKLQHLIPLNAHKFLNLNELDFLYIELLGNRFSKLQDYMGNALFDLCLIYAGDVVDGMTIIDKINKLMRYNLIESESLWRDFRRARNHLAHEYPTQPELTAKYINETVKLAELLLATHARIKEFLLSPHKNF